AVGVAGGVELAATHPGAYELIDHERHTAGVLELRVGAGVSCHATCFTPGVLWARGHGVCEWARGARPPIMPTRARPSGGAPPAGHRGWSRAAGAPGAASR